ncbi:MAG: divalent metal cation transporter, partial [Acidobacteria bacterium]|nr:divalent metal cation transporter [Acidobacteriota bacterium]
YAAFLFAFGLANASLFAACILPLSTAFVICEGLGFESGVDRKLKEAPIFYGLFLGLIILGSLLVLIPNAPFVTILIFSQVANAVLLPFVLFFIVLLASRKDLMGDAANTRTQNTVAWLTSAATVAVTLLMLYTSLFT